MDPAYILCSWAGSQSLSLNSSWWNSSCCSSFLINFPINFNNMSFQTCTVLNLQPCTCISGDSSGATLTASKSWCPPCKLNFYPPPKKNHFIFEMLGTALSFDELWEKWFSPLWKQKKRQNSLMMIVAVFSFSIPFSFSNPLEVFMPAKCHLHATCCCIYMWKLF